jgi:hypothetical protein
MSKSSKWHSNLLYGVLIGNCVPNGGAVNSERLRRSIYRLSKSLLESLGGRVRMGPSQAEGETSRWGKEATTLFLVLCPAAQEVISDDVVEVQANSLASELSQEEVWVTKQRLDVFVADGQPVPAEGR